MHIILEREVRQQDRTVVVMHAPPHFAYDPVARRYEALFVWLDWTQVPEKDDSRPQRGRLPHAEAAYLQAYLVMVNEKLDYHTELHDYLCEHPALVWSMAWRLVADDRSVHGFDVTASVPTARHLRRKLGQLNTCHLDRLLAQTVQHARRLMPELGDTVSVDTKHIYAYVKENNARVQVPQRHNPARQPKGDPDCRLGAKPVHNQAQASGTTTTGKEYLWGYGTGIAVAQTPDKDAVVVGEITQPFNVNDVRYALPVLHKAVLSLGVPPLNITADAAFDAWYVYQGPAERGGVAAIALNTRGRLPFTLGPHDRPVCPCNDQEMVPTDSWIEDTHRVQRFRCTECRTVRKMIIEAGNLMRWRLDRQSASYKALYKQRTATERINSQAKALGIERPRQRRLAPIARRNTLIYIVINLRALQRYHERYLNSMQPLKVA
jgi:hypothetical protein